MYSRRVWEVKGLRPLGWYGAGLEGGWYGASLEGGWYGAGLEGSMDRLHCCTAQSMGRMYFTYCSADVLAVLYVQQCRWVG